MRNIKYLVLVLGLATSSCAIFFDQEKEIEIYSFVNRYDQLSTEQRMSLPELPADAPVSVSEAVTPMKIPFQGWFYDYLQEGFTGTPVTFNVYDSSFYFQFEGKERIACRYRIYPQVDLRSLRGLMVAGSIPGSSASLGSRINWDWTLPLTEWIGKMNPEDIALRCRQAFQKQREWVKGQTKTLSDIVVTSVPRKSCSLNAECQMWAQPLSKFYGPISGKGTTGVCKESDLGFKLCALTSNKSFICPLSAETIQITLPSRELSSRFKPLHCNLELMQRCRPYKGGQAFGICY